MNLYDTVILTGANRGIGLEFARQLAPQCARLLACCRDPVNSSDLQALTRDHSNVQVTALDVTSPAQINDLVIKLAGQPVDLLLNNAGYYGPKPQLDVDLREWRRVLEVNTLAPINLAMNLMDNIGASRRKLIVNVSSKVGSMADNNSGGAIMYRSSKAALNSATRSMALDQRQAGVIAFVVHPGWVQTEMGGPGALIDSSTSAAQLLAVIDQADPSVSGGFLDRDGSSIPW